MFLNDIRNIFDIPWNDARHATATCGASEEVEHSTYSLPRSGRRPAPRAVRRAGKREAARLLERRGATARAGPLVLPAYEAALKCSHLFNVLDARGRLQRHRARGRASSGSAGWPAAARRPISRGARRSGSRCSRGSARREPRPAA